MSVWLPRTTSSIARSFNRSYRTFPNALIYSPAFRPAVLPCTRFLVPHHRLQSTTPTDNSSTNSTNSNNATTSENKTSPLATTEAPLMARAWKKVKHEAQHYWHGSKLLVSEVRISSRLQWKILQGETLTRRERRQVSGLLTVIIPSIQL